MTITILKSNYEIVDTIETITVPDCFVVRDNKIGGGNGEAKLYVGNDNTVIRNFFGEKGFKINCFLLKQDLQQYLKDSESEYKNPEQPYKNSKKIPQLWNERISKINGLNEQVIYFSLEEQTQIAGPRIYVKSEDDAYELIRELSLPNITYLSAIKLKDSEDNIHYYFRLFVDYFGENQHQVNIKKEEDSILKQEHISKEKKDQIIQARKGQGKYRDNLLKECPFCPITLISDDRLLIASHIKPWVKSDINEKTDPKNGFMLTPTYDHLFDRGFISFTEDKKILISPWLSKMTCLRLNIAPNKQYSMLIVEGRENYLKYHRENIFKK